MQFFATDNETQDWLLTDLPSECRPYKLVCTRPIRMGRRRCMWVPSVYDVGDFLNAVRNPVDRPVKFWIWSKTLRPDLPVHLVGEGDPLDKLCAANGLVVLYQGPMHDEGKGASSIAIVDKLVNERTGEVVEHKDYLELFEILRKAIKRELVYSSIRRFPDGTEFEETQRQRMTEGAVQAHNAGYRFRNSPGRYLGKKR